MNYELAKELKDAGFPQVHPSSTTGKPNIFQLIYPDGFLMETEVAFDVDLRLEIGAYAPTLSELIEACGEPFAMRKQRGSTWDATNGGEHASGYSPDEAVARLWRALNHKKTDALKAEQDAS